MLVQEAASMKRISDCARTNHEMHMIMAPSHIRDRYLSYKLSGTSVYDQYHKLSIKCITSITTGNAVP